MPTLNQGEPERFLEDGRSTPRTARKALARRSSSPSLAMWRSIAASMASRLWVNAATMVARLSRTIGSLARSARQPSAWRASTSCLRRAASARRRSSARNVAGRSARLTASARDWAISIASIRSVLARRPRALRKARIALGGSSRSEDPLQREPNRARAHSPRSAPWRQASAGPARPRPPGPPDCWRPVRHASSRTGKRRSTPSKHPPRQELRCRCFALRPRQR